MMMEFVHSRMAFDHFLGLAEKSSSLQAPGSINPSEAMLPKDADKQLIG